MSAYIDPSTPRDEPANHVHDAQTNSEPFRFDLSPNATALAVPAALNDGGDSAAQLRQAAAAFATRLREAQQASGSPGASYARMAPATPGARPLPIDEQRADDGGYDAYARRYSGCAAPNLGDQSGRTLERLHKYATAVQAKKERRDSTGGTLDSRRSSFAALGGAAAAADRAASAALLLRKTSPEVVSAARRGSLGGSHGRGGSLGPSSGAAHGTPTSAGTAGSGAALHSPSDVVGRLENWAHERSVRLSSAAAATAPGYAHSPTLDAKSLELVRQMKGRAGPIEDQLLAEAQRRRAEFDAQAAAQLQHALASARPSISARARSLDREGDVADRLTAYAELYAQRRLQLAQRLEQEQHDASVHARATDGGSGARVNRSSSYSSVRVQSAVERLTAPPPAPAAGSARARRASTGGLREHGEHFTFTPRIDEHSRALAASLEQSAMERLLKPSQAALRRAAEAEREALARSGDEEAMLALLKSHQLAELRECSFAPRVHGNSAKIADAKRATLAHAAAALGGPDAPPPTNRFEMLHLEAKTRALALQKLAEEAARREVQECSFAPSTLENGQMKTAVVGSHGRQLRRSSAVGSPPPPPGKEGGSEGGAEGAGNGTPGTAVANGHARSGSVGSAGSASKEPSSSGRLAGGGGGRSRSLGYAKSGGHEGHVLKRLQVWARRRDERRAQLREEVEQRELAECTFAPRVVDPTASAIAPATPAQPDGGGGGADGALRSESEPLSFRSAVSVSKWLQRQSAGRARQAERADVPHATGEGWRRESTKCAEFEFATDGPARLAKREAIREAIKALQPPVACSVGEAACAPERLEHILAKAARGSGAGAGHGSVGGYVQLAPRSPRSPRSVR